MTGYSLRRRLLLWLFLATATLGIAALTDTWFEARRTAQGVSDRVLAGSALAIAERVSLNAAGGLDVDLPYAALEMLTSTAQDQVFYRVDGPAGALLTGYENLRPAAPPGAHGVFFTDGFVGGSAVRIATLTREISSGQSPISFSVTVAESTLARDALARSILIRSATRLTALALAAAVVVWVAVTVALRPLDRLGDAIALRSPEDLHPVTGATPTEVQGLIEAINNFMQRLDQALNALRNFTGNASHQLRTPLATVRAELAMAARATDPQIRGAASARAETALVRAERVLAQLLVLARVDAQAGGGDFGPVDLAALARRLTADLVPVAARAGIDLGYDGPPAAFGTGDPVLVEEMLQNLIDNAVRYAGRGAHVTVQVASGPDQPVVRIEDSGPGLPPDRRQALQAPTTDRRRPPARTADSTGLGLGLPIVQEIAALMGATVSFDLPPGGRGLRATIRFTPATGAAQGGAEAAPTP
ncbi:MAG TPA: sensor histidine kinase N-terminal domain-containing protein [Paracoccaceae bacterium]|nr:sensor histidine kinase N-terminal domain-containing protein [Paracoccaceae bacterium]